MNFKPDADKAKTPQDYSTEDKILNALRSVQATSFNRELVCYDIEYQKHRDLYEFLLNEIPKMDFKVPSRSICQINFDVSRCKLQIFVKRGN